MAFLKTNILTTRESVFGAARRGQILAVPSGRLDKVSVYLEPVVADTTATSDINVIIEVYDLDILGNPTGSPLISDFKLLSEITISGFVNFRTVGYVPNVVAIVLRVENGDENNHVAWRYVSTSSGGEELLLSTDSGSSWSANPTRKFSYRTFSISNNAIDVDEQTAKVAAGTIQVVSDNTDAEFNETDVGETELERVIVEGNTVAINFGDFVITLVVDQSGSMTWNDRDNLRYDFLKDFIADIDASLPAGSTATYSLIKFRGRRVGKLTIGIQGSESNGLHFDGVRIIRKAGSAPVDVSDGVVVFEGLGQQFVDDGSISPLTPNVVYHYSVFSYVVFDETTYYSPAKDDFTLVVNPPASNRPPFAVANLVSTAIKTDNAGTPLENGDDDYGYRKVKVSWLNPAGFNYSNITLVRRDDRFPESPADGTVLLSNVSTATVSYFDDFGGSYYFPNGLTYYYRIFTENATGVKSIPENSPKTSVKIPETPRPWEQLEPPADVPIIGFDVTPPLPPLVTIEESNGEIKLSWVAADVASKRFKVFYDEGKFPIATDDKGRNYDGTLLFDGNGNSFIHRFLTNGQPHFYVIISLDEVENASTPVKPLVLGRPPKPSETATVFFAPDPIMNIGVENINSVSNRIVWKNPEGPAFTGSTFYFGDVVKIVSTVEFLDSGSSESFLTYEFEETNRQIVSVNQDDVIDPDTAIQFGHVSSLNQNSIIATVEVTPFTNILNRIQKARIILLASLSVKNRTTGATIARIKTREIQIEFINPFELAIKNEPEQKADRRVWKLAEGISPVDPCQLFEYDTQQFPGVYVLSGDPFFALIESSFRNEPLGEPLTVKLSLLDKSTGEPTSLVKLPQTNTTEATLTLTDVEDEEIDRSGQPTGEMTTRSLLPLILPPSNIPGDIILKAEGTFRGFVRNVELEIHYEPILNVDLTLTPFALDNVDQKEQIAFVYLAPFSHPQEEKVPVADGVVTTWSIRPLCKDGPSFPLQSRDDVSGLGVKSGTKGGIAKNIFWGPGEDVSDGRDYEIHVSVQANGMTGDGFGVVTLGGTDLSTVNRIFLRNQDPLNFYKEEIFSDGESVSKWEVLAHPDEDIGGEGSGQEFVDNIVAAGGNVPPNGIEDGRLVTMMLRVENNGDEMQNPLSGDEFYAALKSIRIKTNMTGPNGKAGTVKARVENGKAKFEISVNARVPNPSDKLLETDFIDNLFYRTSQFVAPQTGLSIIVSVVTSVEINGRSVGFAGGGGSLVLNSPPCFVELIEPLQQ